MKDLTQKEEVFQVCELVFRLWQTERKHSIMIKTFCCQKENQCYWVKVYYSWRVRLPWPEGRVGRSAAKKWVTPIGHDRWLIDIAQKVRQTENQGPWSKGKQIDHLHFESRSFRKSHIHKQMGSCLPTDAKTENAHSQITRLAPFSSEIAHRKCGYHLWYAVGSPNKPRLFWR